MNSSRAWWASSTARVLFSRKVSPTPASYKEEKEEKQEKEEKKEKEEKEEKEEKRI